MVHISSSAVMDLRFDRTPFGLPLGIYFGLPTRLSYYLYLTHEVICKFICHCLWICLLWEGLPAFLPVRQLTNPYSFLVSLLHFSIFSMIYFDLISLNIALYLLISLVRACHWCCCLYLCQVFSLLLTFFLYSLSSSAYQGFEVQTVICLVMTGAQMSRDIDILVSRAFTILPQLSLVI